MHIEHMALYVEDLERARDFFVTYFEGEANGGYTNPSTGFRSYFLCFEGDSMIELMNRPELHAGDKAGFPTGYAHIAFSVGSREKVDELTQKLKEDGYKILSGARVTGDGFYESCVADEEGNQIEITV